MENTQNAIQVELSLQILSSDVHSMSAAIVPSAAWRLVWALGTMKNENESGSCGWAVPKMEPKL